MGKGKKVGLFGGTFDPIHKAHLAVAKEAARLLELDRVLFVPAAHPPHKSECTGAGFEDRLRMVELACAGEDRFEASRLEEGQGKSYTLLTIENLRRQLAPDDQILFLIGADAFAEITTWYRWRELIRIVEFVVMSRPGHQYDVPEGTRIHRLETLTLPVSSSAIREKLAAGAEVEELPASVLRYVREHHLYSGASPHRCGHSHHSTEDS